MAIEVIIVRDPDGPTDVQVWQDGVRIYPEEFHVDAGAGWTWNGWTDMRDDHLSRVSDAVRPALEEALTDPPGSEYIDREDQPWLP